MPPEVDARIETQWKQVERGENQRLLAAEYGISQGHVSDILNRKKRKHG